MYCGQCGKKVMANMLFCPFCGSPIVIPEQDEPEAEAKTVETVPVRTEPVQPEPEEPKQISLFDELPAEEEAFEDADELQAEDGEEQPAFEPLPFSFDDIVKEIEAKKKASIEKTEIPVQEEAADPADEAVEEADKADEAPEQKPAPARAAQKHPEVKRKRENKTFIPVKDVDVDNLFMDEESLDEDEYDLDDDYDSGFDQEFEFEEREEGGFFQRHIRGIVGLILMLVLALILLIWAWSPKGQVTLAKLNLAWDAEVYADLGYESYQQESYLLAAKYYEKALARDEDNYDYAHSATVAYYEAEKTENAASMLKKCVELRPDSAEPYRDMLTLYPDPATRPWEITELIKMGYERTGDASLKLE